MRRRQVPDEAPVPGAVCPLCRSKLDGCTATDGGPEAIPLDGDFGFCIYCVTPLRYYQTPEGLRLRTLVPADDAELTDEIRATYAEARAFYRCHPASRRN